MDALGPAELLALWEQGAADTPAGRAVGVLVHAGLGDPREMTLGQRDQALLACHEKWFGDELDGVATCPACGEALELAIAVGDLRAGAGESAAACAVSHDGFDVELRVPRAGDLVPPPADPQELLAQCVLTARCDGNDVASTDLPAAVVLAIDAALAEADPGAELIMAVTCPACAHPWAAVLDPTEFIWERLDRWARRLGDDIHVLASAYGWHEADILALSPRRRRFYLEAVLG